MKMDTRVYNSIIDKKIPYTRFTIEELLIENKELRITLRKVIKELKKLENWKKNHERHKMYKKNS